MWHLAGPPQRRDPGGTHAYHLTLPFCRSTALRPRPRGVTGRGAPLPGRLLFSLKNTGRLPGVQLCRNPPRTHTLLQGQRSTPAAQQWEQRASNKGGHEAKDTHRCAQEAAADRTLLVASLPQLSALQAAAWEQTQRGQEGGRGGRDTSFWLSAVTQRDKGSLRFLRSEVTDQPRNRKATRGPGGRLGGPGTGYRGAELPEAGPAGRPPNTALSPLRRPHLVSVPSGADVSLGADCVAGGVLAGRRFPGAVP